MTLRRPSLVSSALLWFGVLGAPFAWTGLHVVGFGASTAACNDFGARHAVDPNAWALALTFAAGLVAVGALAAAVVMWVATQTDEYAAPPVGRMHFLATIGLILGPLFLFMILMAGLGATVLPQCVQS